MQRKIFFVLLVLVFSISIFSQISIVDLPTSSPLYSQVIKMVETGIMSIDNQGRFRGSQEVLRYDLAEFGVNMLDYFDKQYYASLNELSKRLLSLENQNLNLRISNVENTIFAYDDRLSYLNSSIVQLEQSVSDILAVIQPGHPLNEDNIVFQNILKSSKDVAKKAAENEVRNIANETLESLSIFEERLDDFEKEVNLLNEKYDKSLESLSGLMVTVPQDTREIFQNYIDITIDKEIDALKTSLRSIAKYETALLESSLQETLTSLDIRLSELEGRMSPYNTSLYELRKKVEENEAKINYILTNYSSDATSLKKADEYDLLGIRTDIEALKIRTDNIASDIALLSDQVYENKSHIETFEARQALYDNKISEMQKKYESVVEQIINQNKKLDNIIYELSSISQSATQPQGMAISSTDIKNLQERVASLERTFGVYYDQVSQLSYYAVTFEDLQKNYSDIKKILDKNSSDVEDLKQNVEVLNAQIKAITNLTDLNQDSLTTLKNMSTISQKLYSIESNLEILNRNNYNINNEVVALDNRLSNIEKTLGDFQVSSSEIRELKNAYNELLNKYYDLKIEAEYYTNPKSLKDDLKLELYNEISSEIIVLDKNIVELDKNLKNLESRILQIEKAMIYYDENMSQVTFNTQETANKVAELEKKVQQKESKSFSTTLITSLVGVAVGALVSWLVLSGGD
jgi:chromosome segregation ATPase